MKGVFDFPVTPDQSEKAFGRSLLPREACDSVDNLGAKVLSLKIRHMAFDPKDLLMMGNVKSGKEVSSELTVMARRSIRPCPLSTV